jgi:metal-sulfur cluster biosynthetic enzyme
MGLSDEIYINNFERSFKSDLKTMICPLLDKIGSKMEKKFSEMKSKALS